MTRWRVIGRAGVDGVSDVDDEEEGGVVALDGADVVLGLGFGADEGVVPDFGFADAVAFFEFSGFGGGDIGGGKGILLL